MRPSDGPPGGFPVSCEARVESTRVASDAVPSSLVRGCADLDNPSILDSSAYHPSHGRHTLFACCPLWIMEIRGETLLDGRGEMIAEGAGNIWTALDLAFSSVNVKKTDSTPFVPGWIGYFGYEIGRLVEDLPGRAARDTSLPDMRLAFYDALLVYDAATGRWSRVELVFEDPPERAGMAAGPLVELLRSGQNENPWSVDCNPSPRELAGAAVSNFELDEYKKAVGKCVDYIASGDIFQVNLSQRFEVTPSPAPIEIYRVLRERNPAWYSAWLDFVSKENQCRVLSSSPELFLRVKDGKVVTRPIKGTRPRVGDGKADREASRSLLASEKDNAELAMIIDLLRNDLGRVCRFNSVRVTDRRRLETHPTVFHLVGTVEGNLREGVGLAELLRATFPGGSITGAPKVRAMEIIDQLEPVARGVYTGCVGILEADGSACLNIAIRTIVCDGDRALVQAGGGIVADSSPEAEYIETLDKARALLESIELASGPRR